MDDERQNIYRRMFADDAFKNQCRLELRGLELKAYSSVLSAFRASGMINKERRDVMECLKKHFQISDARHTAESRRVYADPNLGAIADCLHQNKDKSASESWKAESHGVFPSPASFHRRSSNSRELRESFSKDDDKESEHVGASLRLNDVEIDDISDSEEFKIASTAWFRETKKVNKRVQTKKVSIKFKNSMTNDDDESNDDEIIIKQERVGSPDIIDAPTPTKNKTFGKMNNMKNVRRAKRKLLTVATKDGHPSPSSEPEAKIIRRSNSKQSPSSKALNNRQNKLKHQHPKIKFVKKQRTEETSSDEEKEKPHHHHPHEMMTPMKPILKPNMKITGPSPPSRSRGSRGGITRRGRGGRGSGRGRNAHSVAFNQVVDRYSPPKSLESHSHSQYPNANNNPHYSPKSPYPDHKRPPSSPTKTLKVLKPKKPKMVSLSRRKSRLKEKEDDEMQVEWNDYGYDDDAVIMSNKHIPIKKRKLPSGDTSKSDGKMGEQSHSRNANDIIEENGHQSHHDDENDDDDDDGDGGRGESTRNYHNMSTASGDGGGDRLDTSHRSSGGLSGEETDSASEKGSTTGTKLMESPNNNASSNNNKPQPPNSRSSLSPPPPISRQKQRKAPVAPSPSPQLPRITLPPPVFSTSISSLKKRPQKQMSVVDSLNLHLPTTPTASSLAASSARRPSSMGGTGGGIFSNNAQLITASRGGGPGILQQPRKAQPHILSNSKVHQRTFLPVTSNSVVNVGMCMSVGSGTITIPGNNSIVSGGGAGGTILTPHQVHSTVIPSISQAGVVQIPTNASIPMGSMMGARTPGGNVIFLQKTPSSNAVTVSSSSVVLPNNAILQKTAGNRAVILRRGGVGGPARTGNVMLLDVQKNQMVNAGQVPQFLQTTRILTAPPDLSIMNLQGNQNVRKVIQSHPLEQVESSPSVLYAVSSGQNQLRKPQQQIIVTSNNATEALQHHTDESNAVGVHGQSETQIADIEDQLMQMEQDIVYEEEVMTSSEGPEQHCNNNLNNSQKQPIYTVAYTPTQTTDDSSVNNYYVNNEPSSEPEQYQFISTDGSEMQEVHKSVEVEVSLTPELEAINNSTNNKGHTVVQLHDDAMGDEGSSQENHSNNEQDDIFQAALKSSGIVFTEQQFFGVEEEIVNDGGGHSIDVASHIALSNQENGTNP